MLTRDEVENAFIWLLGRNPESESVIEHYMAYSSIDEMRRAIIGTDEFYNQVRSYGKIVKANTWICADLTDTHNVLMWLNLFDRGVSLPCLTGDYESVETRLVKKLLTSGDCFVDIGANIGWFTLNAAAVVGKFGKVISFEPSPTISPWTARSITDNRFEDRVILHHCALSDANGFLLLDRGELTHNPGGSSANRVKETDSSENKHLVKAVIGDVLISQYNPNLIKIDVEGAELLALRGIQKTIAASHPIVICEINPVALNMVSGCSVHELFTFFYNLDFLIMNIENNRLIEIDQQQALRISDAWFNLVFAHKEIVPYLATIIF